MLEHLSTSVPTELPSHIGFFALTPAVPLRFGQDREGELVEVDEKGREVNRWRVRSNALAVRFLEGRRVVIPPGFPNLLDELRRAGATPTVAKDPEAAARMLAGGVDWA